MTQREIWTSDNLDALGKLDKASVTLVYMDPPFASNRDYDVLLSSTRHAGAERASAFTDQAWGTAVAELSEVSGRQYRGVREFIARVAESVSSEIAGYLLMMLPRVVEAHRVLRAEGSLYLHCDTSASHYLKVVLDMVFGAENFRNEIAWKRTHAHSGARRFGPVHDIILFYSRSSAYTWNPSFTAYDETYLEKHFRQEDSRGRYQLITCTAPGDREGTRAHYEWHGQLPPPGRHWAWKIEKMVDLEDRGLLVHSSNGVPRLKRYTDDSPGVALQDVWLDIKRLDAHSEERVGYDTQKPTSLLERIISASTNPGDLVVDPFGGSGTTAVAAESLGRQWISVDSSLMASSFALARTRRAAGAGHIKLFGFPSDVASARRLLRRDSQTFGVWGTSMLAATTDRRSFSRDIASGAGRIELKNRPLDFLSWVPMTSSATPTSVIASRRKRLPRTGLVLRTGRTVQPLRTWLSRELPALPIVEVDLESIVDSESRRQGLSAQLAPALEREL